MDSRYNTIRSVMRRNDLSEEPPCFLLDKAGFIN